MQDGLSPLFNLAVCICHEIHVVNSRGGDALRMENWNLSSLRFKSTCYVLRSLCVFSATTLFIGIWIYKKCLFAL